ncbi:CobW family GTP-binding protein [Chitinophaga nivalis]|uniref:GTP-binding protein n=1 Tax=Chitinophaga nivalis TaxID=2991709 RepID=A0ABT3IP17_9BACT|nr:GTP-binding protein [Chitinophaga nivalis]MCW3464590.1 GTP-binding protein [Chitinophaga nivalis]MCW3485719.1 GTP-binding protein [Chitinophaga nivalis]
MEKENRIKVYIITGFLGAGKTTVLNSLLQQLSASKNIVIENEFGKVNIDATLIAGKIDNLYELTSGCICCSLDNELLEVLGDVLRMEDTPDHVFIETTGIADTGNIIGMLQLPEVTAHYELVRTVCVVDAENIQDRLVQQPEPGKQIACADVLVINKIMALTVPELVSVYEMLEAINPLAFVTATESGELKLRDLHAPVTRSPIPYTPAPVEHLHKINTVLFTTPDAFNLNMLVYVLDFHCNVYPDQLYRIKGYVSIQDSDEKFLVQSTGKYLHITAVGSWGEETPASTLVFIGKDLKSATIQRILQPATKR